MHQPSKWWTGLLPLAAVWAVGTSVKTGSIEADLAAKSQQALGAVSGDALDQPKASVAGRDVRVSGFGFSPASAGQASGAINSAYGVRLVDVAIDSLPLAKPYVFSVKRAGTQFALEGSTPLPSVRAKIAGALKSVAPAATIADGLKYASGAPGYYEAAATYALAQANKLTNGAASFSDGAYTISGEAPTTAAYDDAMAATRQLPQGLTLAKADILAPELKPYAWGAIRDANGISLTGFAPSEAARSAIAARAASAFPGVKIDNKMQIARGAPAGDFAAMAGYGLSELGKLSSGSVGLSDAAYSISGVAPTSAGFEAAVAAMRQLPAGVTLAKADILAPELKPYAWNATSDGKTVTLSGAVPNQAAREAIAKQAAATFSGAQIVNHLQIARGAPGDFAAASTFALSELSKLSEGKAVLSDAAFSLSGTGKAGMTNASVGEEARKGLPQGFKVAAIDVKEPIIAPYVFNAERTDGKIKLTGYFPDQKAHQDILAAAKQRFAGDAVDDQMMQGKGAPNDYAGAIAAGFASLSRLATGSLGVSGNNVTLRGEAFFEKAAGQIRTGFSDAAPQGFRGQSQIAVRAPGARLDAATCQPQLSGLLAKGRILFETAKADIHKDSIGLLDQIAGVSLRCGGSEIEVAGHTDSEGAPERNLNLSKRRAQAVVDYLVEAGVDSGHITAVGYGETKPIASNDTAEGKAQNRRIEMSVK